MSYGTVARRRWRATDASTAGAFQYAADFRYRGQEHTIPIPIASPKDVTTDIGATRARSTASRITLWPCRAG